MNAKNAVLLPSGLYDLLPPDARKESHALSHLLGSFESFGYAQVTPPLLEFESSLLQGRGEALALQTFRVMDPLSQAMMGFRADITMQVARIARSRMASAPRPLRLSYGGPILQTTPEPLKNERQMTQAGIELIGTESAHADAEVITVAAEALSLLGIKELSIDINLPGLLGELCPEAQGNSALRAQIKEAVSRKDAALIASLPVAQNKTLAALAAAAGPMDKALKALEALKLPQGKMVAQLAAFITQGCPHVRLTLDPIEYRGFDYHEGISFSIFAAGLRHELGRGGRYQVGKESATGCSLYVTHLLSLLPEPEEKKRILLPESIDAAQARALRTEGWATLYSLSADARAEAKQLGCSYILDKGKPQKL